MKTIKANIIANNLRELRIAHGLTQQKLADLLYRDIRQIRRFETVGTDKISIINSYAELFNTDAVEILKEKNVDIVKEIYTLPTKRYGRRKLRCLN